MGDGKAFSYSLIKSEDGEATGLKEEIILQSRKYAESHAEKSGKIEFQSSLGLEG